MKYLLYSALLCLATGAEAAPTNKKPTWEYATLSLTISRLVGQKLKRGAELFLPGGKVIFFESSKQNTPAYNTYLLNRMGTQGWELAAVTGAQGSEHRYIFKRQK